MIAIIERNSAQLADLVDDVLEIANADAGRLVLDNAEVSFGELAAERVVAVVPLAREAGLSVELVHADEASIEGDSQRLGQALDNLLSYAIKFTSRGGRIEVSVQAGQEAVPAVTDTRMGIPADEVDHLFERFFRASNAVAGEAPGTGSGACRNGRDRAGARGEGSRSTAKRDVERP